MQLQLVLVDSLCKLPYTLIHVHIYDNSLIWVQVWYWVSTTVFYLHEFEQVFKVLFIIHRHPSPVISPNTIVFHFSVIPKQDLKEGEIGYVKFHYPRLIPNYSLSLSLSLSIITRKEWLFCVYDTLKITCMVHTCTCMYMAHTSSQLTLHTECSLPCSSDSPWQGSNHLSCPRASLLPCHDWCCHGTNCRVSKLSVTKLMYLLYIYAWNYVHIHVEYIGEAISEYSLWSYYLHSGRSKCIWGCGFLLVGSTHTIATCTIIVSKY